jgi:hypothetical protein
MKFFFRKEGAYPTGALSISESLPCRGILYTQFLDELTIWKNCSRGAKYW